MGVLTLFLLVLLGAAMPDLASGLAGVRVTAPDCFAFTALYLALRGRGYRAVGWGIGVGAIQDALSLDPLGTHAFTLGLVALLFSEGAQRRSPVQGMARGIFLFAGVVAVGWIDALRTLPFGGPDSFWGACGSALPAALWTTCVGMPLAALLDRYALCDDLIGRRRALS